MYGIVYVGCVGSTVSHTVTLAWWTRMPSRVASFRTAKRPEATKEGVRSQSHRNAPVMASHQPALNEYSILSRKRFWEVRAPSGELVCLTVYKRGAKEVVRRLGST